MVLIITYFPDNKSEEMQLIKRVGRQGLKGQVHMLILEESATAFCDVETLVNTQNK